MAHKIVKIIQVYLDTSLNHSLLSETAADFQGSNVMCFLLQNEIQILQYDLQAIVLLATIPQELLFVLQPASLDRMG